MTLLPEVLSVWGQLINYTWVKTVVILPPKTKNHDHTTDSKCIGPELVEKWAVSNWGQILLSDSQTDFDRSWPAERVCF